MTPALWCALVFSSTATAQAVHAQASLPGTAWQATVRIPQPTTVVFQFGRDTVRMFHQASRSVIETMVYTTTATHFTLRKVSGVSPCDTKGLGTYAFRIDNDHLLLTLVSDDCDGRSDAFTQEPIQKVTWPAP
jgi:hypothetical protein